MRPSPWAASAGACRRSSGTAAWLGTLHEGSRSSKVCDLRGTQKKKKTEEFSYNVVASDILLVSIVVTVVSLF